MKKSIAIILLFISLLLLHVLPSFGEENSQQIEAKIKFYKLKISKVSAYIDILNQKLKVSKKQSEKESINKLLQAENIKMVKLKKELAEAMKKYKDSLISPFIDMVLLGKPVLAGGYMGGAAAVEIGYIYPINLKLNLAINFGYGMTISGFSANPYTLIFSRGEFIRPLTSEFYLGAGLDWANYSKKVQNILGITGDIDAGGKFGFAAFAGRIFDKITAEISYSTLLGVTFSGRYRF